MTASHASLSAFIKDGNKAFDNVLLDGLSKSFIKEFEHACTEASEKNGEIHPGSHPSQIVFFPLLYILRGLFHRIKSYDDFYSSTHVDKAFVSEEEIANAFDELKYSADKPGKLPELIRDYYLKNKREFNLYRHRIGDKNLAIEKGKFYYLHFYQRLLSHDKKQLFNSFIDLVKEIAILKYKLNHLSLENSDLETQIRLLVTEQVKVFVDAEKEIDDQLSSFVQGTYTRYTPFDLDITTDKEGLKTDPTVKEVLTKRKKDLDKLIYSEIDETIQRATLFIDAYDQLKKDLKNYNK